MNHKHMKQHLPFINDMIASFKTAEFKQKWQNMKDLIESKNLTDKQIETIDMNIKKAKQLKEQYKKNIDITNVSPVAEIKKDEGSTILNKNTADVPSKSEDKASIEECMDAKKLKQMKELKRLHENIVKDDTPLPSKRRSAQKRSYRDSLELLLEKSDKPVSLKKRKSEIDVDKNSSKDDSILSQEILNTPEAKPTAQASLKSSEISKSVVKASSKSNETKLGQRKSFKTVEIKPIVQEKPKSFEVPKIVKQKRLKSPEIKPISIQHKSIDKIEPEKEQATSVEIKKSSLQKLKKKIQKQHKKEIFKKKSRATMLTKGASKRSKLDDDEWEDMEDNIDSDKDEEMDEKIVETSIENDLKLAETKVDMKVEEKPEPTPPIVIKKVQNISYIPCKTGFIFKCLVQDCKFQTMDNPAFVDHIENEHLTIKWQGNCEICNGKVDATRSIIFELMHMRENHLLKESTDSDELPDITEYPASETKTEKEITKEESLKDEKIEQKIPETIQLKAHGKLSENIKLVGKKIDIGKIKLVPFSGIAIPSQRLSIETGIKIKKVEDSSSDLSRSTSTQSGTSSSSYSKSMVNEVQPKESEPVKSKSLNNNEIQSENQALNEKPAVDGKQKIVKHIIVKPPQVKESSPIVVKPKQPTEVKPVETSTPKPKSSSSEDKVPTTLVVNRHISTDNQKDMNTVDLLRPWLKRKIKKYLMPTTRFLDNVAAITATYKCMSSKCCFYTSDQKLFNIHLRLHETHLPGDRDYINCSYCDYIFTDNEGINSLIEHIDKEHCFDKYQCKYCFYRSCVSLNVINHQRIHHAMKPKSVYELPIEKTRNYDQELSAIKKSRIKFVPPLTCVKCYAKFYIFPKLLAHMQTHGSNIKTKCTKCSEVSTMSNIHSHFINCHNLGLYQCVFCIFGSNNFETMVNHIGGSHPSKPPIYCERFCEKPDEVNPSSIESTCLKFLTQQVDHRIIEVPKLNDAILRNERNVGDLGGNFKVFPVKKVAKTLSNNDNSDVAKSQHIVKNVLNKPTDDKVPTTVSKRIQIEPPNTPEISKEVKVIKKLPQKSPQSITNEKSSGLQIKSVYSLNNSKKS